MPGLALEPLGLGMQLNRLKTRMGESEMAAFAAKLLLQTAYQKTPAKQLQSLILTNPSLYNRTVRQVQAAVPEAARQSSEQQNASAEQSAPAWSKRQVAVPLIVSGLFSAETHSKFLDDLIFTHYYQAPRGKEGSSLAAMPLWFPVANPPSEQMTLTQIIYRSLASVREPFRRTRIVAETGDKAHQIYTEMLEWGFNFSRSNFGASMLPIPMSLSCLTNFSSELTSMAAEIRQASVELASTEGFDRQVLYYLSLE